MPSEYTADTRNDDQPSTAPFVISSDSCVAGTVETNFHAPPLDAISILKFVNPVTPVGAP